MAQTQIKAILFDLGETLLNFGKVYTSELFRQAGKLSYDFLRQAGQPVGGFRCYLWRNLLGLRMRTLMANVTGRDFDSLQLLKKYGQKKGFDLSDQQWQEANRCWYEPLRRRACTEPHLAQTLAELTGAGLKLGVVSNTFVNACSLDAHLAEEGLLDYLRLRIYSYQAGFRKPDRRIFLAAARKIGESPENILFVGDRIDKDVKGALRAGMRSVLKIAYTNTGKKTPKGVPKIDTIAELPSLVRKINAKEK